LNIFKILRSKKYNCIVKHSEKASKEKNTKN
jgi:hypothetical protein